MLLSYSVFLLLLTTKQQSNPYFFLRKEVIQPHLPIRLPCYDFTPVIRPAFGSSFFAVRSLTSGVTDSRQHAFHFLSLTGLSPSLVCFPKTVLLELLNQFCGPNPGMHALRFGLFRFRSPLLTESLFLSLPLPT